MTFAEQSTPIQNKMSETEMKDIINFLIYSRGYFFEQFKYGRQQNSIFTAD